MGEAKTVRGLRAGWAVASFALDPIKCLEHFWRKHGPAVRIEWRRSQPILALVGPRFNRDVLMATDRLRPTGVWPVQAPDGTAQANLRRNLLTVHGPEHKVIADCLSPFLERGQVEAYFDRARAIALSEISSWPAGRDVDVGGLFRDLAQRFAFEILFGIDDRERALAFGASLSAYHAANWSRIAALLRLDLPGLPYRTVLKRAEDLQQMILGLMREAQGCPVHAHVRADMTSLKDHTGADLPKLRAAAQLASIAMASHETTSTTLSWAFVLLSQHPEVMEELSTEIASAGPVEALSSDRLESLPLLDGVLKETLRLMAPVPILGFKTLRACEVAGFDLPQNATILISPHLTHRMPDLYDEPDQFRPKRWTAIRPTTYEYLPFSGGPRRCPGYLFAMANMRLAMSAMLSRFHVEPAPRARIDRVYAAVNVPKGAIPAVLSPRIGQQALFPAPARRGSAFDLFAASAPLKT